MYRQMATSDRSVFSDLWLGQRRYVDGQDGDYRESGKWHNLTSESITAVLIKERDTTVLCGALYGQFVLKMSLEDKKKHSNILMFQTQQCFGIVVFSLCIKLTLRRGQCRGGGDYSQFMCWFLLVSYPAFLFLPYLLSILPILTLAYEKADVVCSFSLFQLCPFVQSGRCLLLCKLDYNFTATSTPLTVSSFVWAWCVQMANF